MAQFKFPLQGVLRHRELTEQAKQRDLAVAAADRAAVEADLQRIDDGMAQALGDLRANHLVGKIDLNYLAAHRRYALAVQRQRDSRAATLAQAKQTEAAARAALAEAAKQVKVLETLRDQQRTRWAEGIEKQERSAADEVAMQMAAHGRAADESADCGGGTPEVRL